MPRELREGEIEVEVYLDSGANIHSKNTRKMRVDKEEWEEMDDREKSDMVLEHFANHSGFDYGWEDPE